MKKRKRNIRFIDQWQQLTKNQFRKIKRASNGTVCLWIWVGAQSVEEGWGFVELLAKMMSWLATW